MISYDGKRFRSKSNTDNGEVSDETIFVYHQENDVVWAEYSGGAIVRGTLIGTADKDGRLSFYYQHINSNHVVKIGRCQSTPYFVDGRLELHEQWQWLSGACSKGASVLIEQ